MAKKESRTAAEVRPYWVPPQIKFEQLPEGLRVALATLVQPTYHELVLGAADALERSAGATLTFLLALEVIEHFQLGSQLLLPTPGATELASRDRRIAGLLRIVNAKQHIHSFLVRLREARNKRELMAAQKARDPLLAI